MKDNFSKQSETYSKFRPTYPDDFITEIVKLSEKRSLAWDCGTGNGQVAVKLSPYFEKIIATDISEKQLSHAPEKENILYKVEPAESTSINTNSINLITVAQAIHWFKFDPFFAEVNRVLKKGGIIALFGYDLLKTNLPLDDAIQTFYTEIVGPYWDDERMHIVDEYARIPFPFESVKLPEFNMHYQWTFDQFVGYFRSWSAVQHYISANDEDPVKWIENELKRLWPGSETVTVSMKIINKTGRKSK